MKKNKKKNEFLDHLKKVPIIQVACEKAGLSRTSVYRWKDEDEKFKEEMEIALTEGEALVNDMSESQLLTMIKEKNWPAISFWLRHRNPKFKDKVEITTKINNDVLSPEQEVIVREALNLAAGINKQNHESSENNSPGTGGNNVEGQESANSGN